jgi:hypothetical protein
MLKLTREKGAELFLALAANFPGLQFRAVCADPWTQQQVAQAGLTNVQLVGPQGALYRPEWSSLGGQGGATGLHAANLAHTSVAAAAAAAALQATFLPSFKA